MFFDRLRKEPRFIALIATNSTSGGRHDLGDYEGIAHSLDYPCSSGLPLQVIAASAVVLRGNPQFLQFPRLRIVEVGTNQDNLTLYYREIRSGLQATAHEKP